LKKILLTLSLVVAQKASAHSYSGVVGLTNEGTYISLSNGPLRYKHKNHLFGSENYSSESIGLRTKLYRKGKFTLRGAVDVGYEQHDNSNLYNRRYVIYNPELEMIQKRPGGCSVRFGVELGKGFYTIGDHRSDLSRITKYGYDATPKMFFGVGFPIGE